MFNFLPLKSYSKDTAGSIAIWAAFTTPVLIGGAALSVDAARLYNMDNDLQSASDALARAGAAELDQRSDSLERSSRAIQNLLTFEQKFSDRGAGKIEIESIRYLKSVPSNDYDDIPASEVTYTPSEAKYVEVKVKPETVSTLFPMEFLNGVTKATLESKSVAGLDQEVCGAAPIFVCNPLEGTNQSIYEAMETAEFRRKQLVLKSTPSASKQYGAGNFGWLDPFGGNSGASVLADAIAIDNPPTCISKTKGVVLRTGNISSMRFAVNTRFDIYEGSFKKKKNDPSYAPAANVTKGMIGGNLCKPITDIGAFGLPRDNCFLTGECSLESSAMGDGEWDFVSYMRINHNQMSRITIEDVTYNINYYTNTFTPSEPPSRYAMYRWEIENDCVPGPLTYGVNVSTPEEGLPQCHQHGASTSTEDRRIIHAAVLNCLEIEANSPNGMWKRKDPLPVETFVKVFLTEPMGQASDDYLLGEIIGPIVPGIDSQANDKVSVIR